MKQRAMKQRAMNKRRDEGFSLIEVLAAITLMALSAALISQALRFGVLTSDRLTARTDALTTQTIARRTLTRLISRALPPGPDAIFEGDPTRLTFTRQALSPASPGPLVLSEIEVVGTSLILRECAAILQARGLVCKAPKEERLQAIFDAPISFIYLNEESRDESQWRNEKTLPKLVKLAGGAYPLVIKFDLGAPW